VAARAAIVTAAILVGFAADLSTAHATGSWSITRSGYGVGMSPRMPAGRVPTAAVVPGTANVSVDWQPSTFPSGVEVARYLVNRKVVATGVVTPVCNVAAPLRTCQDSPPPSAPVTYTVTPLQGLWRGPESPPSSPVAATTALAAIKAPTPTPAAAPTPTPTPSATPTPTPSATPTPTATATPTPTPTH
jgi:hypothetical protein